MPKGKYSLCMTKFKCHASPEKQGRNCISHLHFELNGSPGLNMAHLVSNSTEEFLKLHIRSLQYEGFLTNIQKSIMHIWLHHTESETQTTLMVKGFRMNPLMVMGSGFSWIMWNMFTLYKVNSKGTIQVKIQCPAQGLYSEE